MGGLEILKFLQEMSHPYVRQLSPIARHELAEYQQGSWINDALRRNILPEARDAVTPTLDDVLRSAPKLPVDIQVYRGAPNFVYPGTEHGYLSTSLDRNIAAEFVNDGDTLYSIHVPRGTPFVMPGDIGGSEWGRQQELILPRSGVLQQLGPYLKYQRGNYAQGGAVR